MEQEREQPLDYAGRTPVRPPDNWGKGGENKALAEGCASVVLLFLMMPVIVAIVGAVVLMCLSLVLAFFGVGFGGGKY